VSSANLWVHWAEFEERQGNYERAIELFEIAEHHKAHVR
jgi:hypothetical protein